MAFFPILIRLDNAPCLIAGGGAIACHKAKVLLENGADVTVVAPEVCAELAALPVKICRRAVTAADAADKALVVDATGDPAAKEALSAVCAERRIPYNCNGFGESCTAIFPAVYRKGRTTLAVSSIGASPAASAWLRDRLAADIPERMDDILDCMAALRPLSHRYFADQPTRRVFLNTCLRQMLQENRTLSPEEIEAVRRETETEQKERKEAQT